MTVLKQYLLCIKVILTSFAGAQAPESPNSRAEEKGYH